eukprot:Rmarinus@m.18341
MATTEDVIGETLRMLISQIHPNHANNKLLFVRIADTLDRCDEERVYSGILLIIEQSPSLEILIHGLENQIADACALVEAHMSAIRAIIERCGIRALGAMSMLIGWMIPFIGTRLTDTCVSILNALISAGASTLDGGVGSDLLKGSVSKQQADQRLAVVHLDLVLPMLCQRVSELAMQGETGGSCAAVPTLCKRGVCYALSQSLVALSSAVLLSALPRFCGWLWAMLSDQQNVDCAVELLELVLALVKVCGKHMSEHVAGLVHVMSGMSVKSAERLRELLHHQIHKPPQASTKWGYGENARSHALAKETWKQWRAAKRRATAEIILVCRALEAVPHMPSHLTLNEGRLATSALFFLSRNQVPVVRRAARRALREFSHLRPR